MARKSVDVPPLMKLALAVDKDADDLENFTLITDPKANEEIVQDISRQLQQTTRELRAIARRLRRMNNLAANSVGHYIVLDPVTGELRPASADEALRAAMHYLPKGVGILEALNYGRVDEDKDIVVVPDAKQ